ncbi:unnamed protein product [Prorocentrum cordatum]|uniref:RNA-directed RNA polymerase n=1 Tax=Prorocentrum cordatum TaxID=2364126 RepID=A0ABN9PNZ3_9DINO|nr:unnamed protein product [Polarella glacialis]
MDDVGLQYVSPVLREVSNLARAAKAFTSDAGDLGMVLKPPKSGCIPGNQKVWGQLKRHLGTLKIPYRDPELAQVPERVVFERPQDHELLFCQRTSEYRLAEDLFLRSSEAWLGVSDSRVAAAIEPLEQVSAASGSADADAKGCLALDAEAMSEFFAVGPPWVVRFQDLQRAAPLWQAYTPRIRRQYRQLIAEMYAYSLALASIDVRHALFDHFVVSYPNAPVGEQAWPWIDASDSDVCGLAPDPAGSPLPTFLHYCEVYHSEDWYFQKRDVPHSEVLSCQAPLFAEPPGDLLRKRRGGAANDPSDWARQAVRHAWYLCKLLPTLNEAVGAARAALCPEGVFNATKGLRVPLPKGEFYAALSEFFKGNT